MLMHTYKTRYMKPAIDLIGYRHTQQYIRDYLNLFTRSILHDTLWQATVMILLCLYRWRK